MKKIALGLAVFGLFSLIGATAAISHGTCNALAGLPNKGSGQTVNFAGIYDCGATVHASTEVHIYLQRRPGSSTQNNWDTIQGVGIKYPNTEYAADSSTYLGYNCAKDYRTVATGSATGHPIDSDNSPIFQNTC